MNHHETITLYITPQRLAVGQLTTDTQLSSCLPLANGAFFCLTKTDDEISIVCDEAHANGAFINLETGWRMLKVGGPLPFHLTGILNQITQPLAEHKVSIFAVSTYDTDYILIKDEQFSQALDVLKQQFLIKELTR